MLVKNSEGFVSAKKPRQGTINLTFEEKGGKRCVKD
jgi:hypothetical protein